MVRSHSHSRLAVVRSSPILLSLVSGASATDGAPDDVFLLLQLRFSIVRGGNLICQINTADQYHIKPAARSVPSRIALCGAQYMTPAAADLGTRAVRCRNRFYSAPL